MSDRLFFSAAAAAAVLMVALALVWPQGQGARSPGPFGHEPELPGYVLLERAKKGNEAAVRTRAADVAAAAAVPLEGEPAATPGQAVGR
jgi:hypothetical protein